MVDLRRAWAVCGEPAGAGDWSGVEFGEEDEPEDEELDGSEDVMSLPPLPVAPRPSEVVLPIPDEKSAGFDLGLG